MYENRIYTRLIREKRNTLLNPLSRGEKYNNSTLKRGLRGVFL
jgi:hypothetical protein